MTLTKIYSVIVILVVVSKQAWKWPKCRHPQPTWRKQERENHQKETLGNNC